MDEKTNERERNFYSKVQSTAREYHRLVAAYDAALLAAHNAGHGTPDALRHLAAATGMAADVMKALDRHQMAVAEMFSYYCEKQRLDSTIQGRG